MNPSPIKAIFFDAVGTLFDVKGSVGEVYSTYAQKYGFDATEQTQRALNAAFKQTMKEMPLPVFSVDRSEKLKQCERLWWFDVVHAVFYRVGMFEEFDDFFEEVFEAFGQATHWELYPESLEVLSQLKQKGFELGIISNFDSRFFQVSRALKLNEFFDSVTISSLAQAVKPASKIFAHALDQHMVFPHEALHVGDHYNEDYEGAQKAGLHAVLIDRSANTPPNNHTVTNLTQLFSYELLFPKEKFFPV
jgi:putative hydrolase of the HAD superfamily